MSRQEILRFTVDAGGVIAGVVGTPLGCQHATGADGEDGGATVQLFPFADTPNRSGGGQEPSGRRPDLLR